MDALVARVIALAMFAAGCSEDAVPAPHRFVDPAGAFAVEYDVPPWRTRTTTPLVLEVPSNAETFLGDDAGEIVPSKYVLEVSVVAGSPRALADADSAATSMRSEDLRVPVRAVRTDSGDEGFELIAFTDEIYPRFHRYVYFGHPSGAVRLYFDASPDLDGPEVDRMIRRFDVAPGDP